MGIFDKLGKKQDDKPRTDFSNVQSGGSSTAAEAAPTNPAPVPGSGPAVGTAGREESYVVVSGDSLSKIAKRYYGDAQQWRRIYDANRDQVKDPDLIHPGQRLKIPGA